MSRYIYKIDHYYNIDHIATSPVIATDIEKYDLVNILAVILLKFEELIEEFNEEGLTVDEQHILMLLKKYYGVEDVKDQYKKYLHLTNLEDDDWKMINTFDMTINDGTENLQIIQIDLYEARESNLNNYYKGKLTPFLPDSIQDFENEIKSLRKYYIDMV